MATRSFYEMMEIDTQEKADRLVEAYRAAEKRGPMVNDSNVFEQLEEGRKFLKDNPDWLKKNV